MKIQRLAGHLTIGAMALLLTVQFAAAAVYEAVGVNYQTGKRDIAIKLSVGANELLAELSVAEKLRVSMIELPDRVIVIDHVAGTYAIRYIVNRARDEPVAWLSTSRQQFALGGYCPIFELRIADVVRQERCNVASSQALGANIPAHFGNRTAEFLAKVSNAAEPQDFFALALAAAEYGGGGDAVFPLRVRSFDGGKLVGEYRMLRVITASLPRDAFSIPRGLQHIVAERVFARQAAQP